LFRRLGLSREFNGSHRMQHVPEKSYVLCSRILRLIESNGPSAALKDIEHELRNPYVQLVDKNERNKIRRQLISFYSM